MDYFQELLLSYQKIKNRTFRVSFPIDEAVQLDPQAKALADQYITQAQSVQNQPPPNNKITVPQIPGSFIWIAQEGKARGQPVFDGFPNAGGRALAVAGTGNAKQNYNDFIKLLTSEQEGQPKDKGAEQQNAPTQESPTNQVVSASWNNLESRQLTISLGDVALGLKERGTFFSSTKKMGGSFFKWLSGRNPEYVTDYFHSGSNYDLEKKIENATNIDGTPLSDEQKQQFLETFKEYLDVCEKLDKNPNDPSLHEDLQDIAKKIEFGAGNDKRKMRIKVGVGNNNQPIYATIGWAKGSGNVKDTNMLMHINLSYEEKVKEWAKNQNPQIDEGELEGFLLPVRKRFTEFSKSVGAYNQIVGRIGEEVPVIVSKMLNGLRYKTEGDIARGEASMASAAKDLIKLTEDYRFTLFEALRIADEFKTGQIAVLDPTLAQITNLDELRGAAKETISKSLDTIKMQIEQESGISMTPENLDKLTSALVDNALAKLMRINVIIQNKLRPNSIISVGENTRNGKKTDHLYTYNTEEDAKNAIRALVKKMPNESDKKYAARLEGMYKKFILPTSAAEKMYPEIKGQKYDPNGVVVHVGVKTSIVEGSVVAGTSSPKQTDQNFTQAATPQMQAMYKRIQKEHGVPESEVRAFYEQCADARAKFDDTTDAFKKCKKNGKYREVPPSVAKLVLTQLSDDESKARYGAKLNSGKITEDLYQKMLTELQDKSDSIHLDSIRNLVGSKDANTKNKGIALLDSLISNAGNAEEVPQLLVAGVLGTGNVKVADQNKSMSDLVNGLKDGSLRLDPESDNFVFQRCLTDNCDVGEPIANFALADGGYTMKFGSRYIKQQNNELTGSESGYLGEAKKLYNDLLKLLFEQRKLIDTIITKYQ